MAPLSTLWRAYCRNIFPERETVFPNRQDHYLSCRDMS